MAAPKKTTATTKPATKPAAKTATKPATKTSPAKALAGEKSAPATKTATKPAAKKPTASKMKAILAQPAMPTDAITDTVTAIDNLKKDQALPLVSEMMNTNDFNEFKMGGVLSVIQANGYWKDEGHETFKDFIENYYGLQYRKAMYLIQIFDSLVEANVEWDQVKDLGWTKLKEICKFLTEDNVEGWVELASGMTVLALQNHLKHCDEDGNLVEPEQKGSSTNPAQNNDVSTMTFKVHKDQREIIREGLDKAKEEFGTEHDNVALEHLCTQYIQGSLGKKAPAKKQKTLEEQVSALVEADGDEALEKILGLVEQHYPELDITVAVPEGDDEEGEEELEEEL